MTSKPQRIPLEMEKQVSNPAADGPDITPREERMKDEGGRMKKDCSDSSFILHPSSFPLGDIEDKVVEVLKTCYDPEIPVNVYEMGLIYDIDVTPERSVTIRMTLTSPACPVAGSLPPEIEAKVRSVPGVASSKVEIVWDPPWTPERMSDAAKLQLGLF